MSFKPVKTHDNNNDVNKSQVGKYRNKVDIELLIRLEILHIDTSNGWPLVKYIALRNEGTNVFRPDSVDALAPKNHASIAAILP